MSHILKPTIKIILKGSLLLLIVILGYANFRLYYAPDFRKIDGKYYNEDVYDQLRFLKNKLRHGSGMEMQSIYPEGFIFLNALYGLSWCNVIENLPETSAIFKEGMTEINWALKEIHSREGKSFFPEHLPLEYGAFYKGWSNYFLGKKLAIVPVDQRDSTDIALFKTNCRQISDAMDYYDHPYIESYENLTWPADGMICIASLRIHDQLFEKSYVVKVDNWVSQLTLFLDEETGLIPHSVDSQTGKTTEGARGSSQSLMLNFLNEIDSSFSKKQFELYLGHFYTQRFFLPGIKEYPKAKSGIGDIDSGPVILGVGGAASVVGQRTMGVHRYWSVYQGLRNSIELFGFGYRDSSGKNYLFGQLPMADAFIAWSNSIEYAPDQLTDLSNWRLAFQLCSVLLLGISVYLIRK